MADFQLDIPDERRRFLADIIREAGGNEVFFLGRVEWGEDEYRAKLGELDVLARGHASAAPAIIEGAERWDIAIHNHPSGSLTPSDADIAVASQLGNRQVGFAIIDNEATRLNLVVPPLRTTPLRAVEADEVRAIFEPGGALAKALSGPEGADEYQFRQGQLDLALEVTESLNSGRVVACEAGTGVGKSFAYLVPSILWAARNRRRVIVSTNTINLQEQLLAKDLPLLSRALDAEFTYAIIKGRGNYACKRKVGELRGASADLFDRAELASELEDLVAWAGNTADGSRGDLAMTPSPEVWEQVMSETDKSLRVQCDHYSSCFFYQARREAFKADVLVVNHHLFFADLAVRRETGNYQLDLILPACERVVFDEAHHLEDVASRHLGRRFTQEGISRSLGRLVSLKNPNRGVLPALARKLRGEGAVPAADHLENKLIPEIPEIARRVESALDEAVFSIEERERVAEEGRGWESSGRPSNVVLRLTGEVDQVDLQGILSDRLGTVEGELARLAALNSRAISTLKQSAGLEGGRRESLMLELTALEGRIERLIDTIAFFRGPGDTRDVKWLEMRPSRRRRGPEVNRLSFASSPIRVSGVLRESVFEPLRSVVLTSATLSVDGRAEFYEDRLGLEALEAERYRFREVPSPFRYPEQVELLLPTDLPDPRAPEFEGRCQEAIRAILESVRGRTFVLFTSYAALRRCHDRLEPFLRERGLRALCQGERGRTELLESFRSTPSSVLFGTDSFWEGVDVKGRALECVILTRLPFRVPTEPVQIARVEELERRGIAPFPGFTVPQAVLKLKQGFGRLIRTDRDRGVVFVLDPRIIEKRYGQVFLRSLPPARQVRGRLVELVRSMERFLDLEPRP